MSVSKYLCKENISARNETLSKKGHELLNGFLDIIFDEIKNGELDKVTARAWLAHLVALMQNEGARNVVDWILATKEKHPNIPWRIG